MIAPDGLQLTHEPVEDLRALAAVLSIYKLPFYTGTEMCWSREMIVILAEDPHDPARFYSIHITSQNTQTQRRERT